MATNKNFWQPIKPLIFSIDFIDRGVTLCNDEETAKTFKIYFCNIAKTLS